MIRLTSVTGCNVWLAWGIAATLGLCTACSTPDPTPTPRRFATATRAVALQAAQAASATTSAVTDGPAAVPPGSMKPEPVSVSTLKVKRLVVTTGVKDREPVADGDALLANGSPIYAFAELSNPLGKSENIRITFERKAGAERVGNVTLPVPGQASRHRTWAVTRFIRAPGMWDAGLWSESGAELGRTSFEVTAS
jgi:hypothetical protein